MTIDDFTTNLENIEVQEDRIDYFIDLIESVCECEISEIFITDGIVIIAKTKNEDVTGCVNFILTKLHKEDIREFDDFQAVL